ncbi:hypothetical protein AM609_02170 [Actinomyces sp. oral taxon 414]|jgi:hypothetical protein|uniref:PLDc N-terminal domain-containing protein n=1 Tax=Actinomyces TaxID=1654 RepID=UPI0006AE24F6|nr:MULTISPECIES: PLDc N-terminal domain-containing protein [Actinomyces]ALC98578.1 hypothetical protein AM609_02170 [Actinomyces sp. oral taxon 414]
MMQEPTTIVYSPQHVIVLVIVLVLTVVALVQVWRQNNTMPTAGKVVWTAVIIILVGVGPVAWYCWRLGDRLLNSKILKEPRSRRSGS